VFWKLSVYEFLSALEGYKLTTGQKKKINPMLRDEMEELMRKYPD
tara:strand:+ start:780 stop:914 length:135 start_codon:yes stop_codon:yes gene_type:complete